jgi:hypothetical protein
LAYCESNDYKKVIDKLLTSNIDTYKIIKHYIEKVKLNKNVRKKLIDIACTEPVTALFIINDCNISEDERNYVLNIIFQKPEYSLLFRRYSKINSDEEKYKAMECIIQNNEYFHTLVCRSDVRHFIPIDEKDKQIMINKILEDNNFMLAKDAYYSKFFNMNEEDKDRLWSLVTVGKLINN